MKFDKAKKYLYSGYILQCDGYFYKTKGNIIQYRKFGCDAWNYTSDKSVLNTKGRWYIMNKK